nr:MAG TPA: hypothetical protein [Caudoviricetes sp.]
MITRFRGLRQGRKRGAHALLAEQFATHSGVAAQRSGSRNHYKEVPCD